MNVSTVLRWVGPAAIAGGLLMVFSDLLNLTIYVPGLGEAANTGYQAVGLGVILLAMTLLFVGMLGLYARHPKPGAARVIEYGDARARYVLVEETHELEEAAAPAREQKHRPSAPELRSPGIRVPAPRPNRTLPQPR